MQRQMGRCPRGLRLSSPGFFVRGQAYHALAAMTTTGFVGSYVTTDPFTSSEFELGFMQSIAPLVRPGSVVIIDNWAGHHANDNWILDVYARGGRVMFLPAYSPTFNPIETGFFHAKRFMQSNVRRAHTYGDVGDFLHAALQVVSAEAARMAFHTCKHDGDELYQW